MYKKVLFQLGLVACICTGVFLVSCGGGGNDSPSEVVEKSFKALIKNDISGSLKYFDMPAEATAAEIKMMQDFVEEMHKENPIVSFEILEESISSSGERATVTIKVVYQSGRESTDSHRLTKTDKGWKIDFM